MTGRGGDLRDRLDDRRRSRSTPHRSPSRRRSPRRPVSRSRSLSRSSGRSSKGRKSPQRRSRSKRSRGKARSRRARRSRSNDDLSRSVSRELYNDTDPQLGKIANLLNSQQEVLLDLFSEHKAEIDGRLQEKRRRFGSRQLERQFEVVSGFKDLAQKVKSALDEKEYRRATTTVEALLEQLEIHEENLVIADTSPHGWLAVAKVRSAKDLPKNVRKRLEQVDKELSSRSRNGGPRRRNTTFQRDGQNPLINRGNRKISPEEALFIASNQVRTGTCTLCKKEQHFYKECPLFWQKVGEARAAKNKDTTSN